MNETLSQAEAMDFLKIKSRVTLLKIIKSGKLKRTQVGTKQFIYLKSDLINFINENKQ